jgi:hypothetical protein
MPDRTELTDALAAHIGTTPLTQDEVESVLDLAGAVAHGTGDRTTAPLASFLAGIAAATTGDRAAALQDVRRRANELAPAPDAS